MSSLACGGLKYERTPLLEFMKWRDQARATKVREGRSGLGKNANFFTTSRRWLPSGFPALSRAKANPLFAFALFAVRDLMIIEPYSQVMHIVSRVEGKFSADKTNYALMPALQGSQGWPPPRPKARRAARRASSLSRKVRNSSRIAALCR